MKHFQNMDHHHKTQILNILSSAVSQLDLSDKKLANKNPFQINELLNMILAKLRVQKLIHLRSVCSHWKSMIEAICGQKQCLKFYSVFKRVRFDDTIEIEQLVLLRLKRNKRYITPFENDCATSLGKLFPNITQLVVSVFMDEDAVMNLFDMIGKYWPGLNTLSIKELASDIIHLSCDRISELKSLKQLDLWGDLKCVPTTKLFNQLEQLSCYDFGTNKILTKIPQLGPNCSRFWYGYSVLPASAIDHWIQRNSSQVLAKLTHLDLSWVYDHPDDPLTIRLICENFPSLKVFKFKYSRTTQFNSTTCAQLSKFSHLNKLSIGSAQLDFESLDKNREQSKLLSIRVFHLNEFEMFHQFDVDSPNYERFFRTLASLVPNVEELGICGSELSRNSITHAMIQDHLICFRKLRKYTDLASFVVKLK